MSAPISEIVDHDIPAAARRVPLIQSAVADFAAQHSAERLSAAFAAALPTAGAHAATVLAVAAARRGAKLDGAVVRSLLPELDSIALFGPLIFASGGDRIELLVRFLDDGAGSWEREALAILLATDLLSNAPSPPRLLARARQLARKSLEPTAALLFGAAASRLGDVHLDALGARYIALARQQPKLADVALEMARKAPLDALPTAAPPRVSSGYTVRNDGPGAGRNDPCPCGSGKKYKKCCIAKTAEVSAEPPSIDPRLLTWEQVGGLRPSTIAELDPDKLSRRARIEGFRKLLTYRRWSAAERFCSAICGDLDAEEAEDWRVELIDAAIRQGARDVVERHVAALPPEHCDRRLQIFTECMGKPPNLIERLNEHARVALEEEGMSVETLMSLAFALVDHFPALGILVARGALTKERYFDSYTLLEAMEEARDELGVAPFEPWWDIWEQISDGQARPGTLTPERAQEVEKITSELRRARAKADEAAVEVADLRRRLKALEAAPMTPRAVDAHTKPEARNAVGPAPTNGEIVEVEKKRLRGKVEELQRIISQGQEERRDLRQRLASAGASSTSSASTREVVGVSDDADELGSESIDRPRRVLVPSFATRASKAIGELSAETAELVLVLVAELAAGRENAWRGVKRLRVRRVLSARAGIHYRILFSVDEGVLDVVHVTHRRDLEQTIASLQ
jgi:hypothetical protein